MPAVPKQIREIETAQRPNGDIDQQQGSFSRDAAAPRWYQQAADAVLTNLGVDPGIGLTPDEAKERLRRYGPNELVETGAKSPFRILWEQVTATMVLILIAAAAISAAVSDWKDAAVILAIVVLFTLLGFIQEYRAERAMAALKKLPMPVVRVRRDGRVQEVGARELVPGDIVLLEAGNLAPADCRVIESVNLRMQEAALTGESEPVEKTAAALPGDELALGDRRNMAFMGTVVTYGRGQAVVVESGMRTQLGRIASMLQTVKHELTPLQRRLDQLGRAVGVIAVAVAALIFILGLLRGEDLRLMFMTAVSVAVAAVPEGLPAVVTITLALGAQRMLRRQALLRKLPAVETLGSVTVICSDKTGTLTENRMTVTVLDVAGHRVDLTEQLDERGRAISGSAPVAEQPWNNDLHLLVAGGALCNDATLQSDPDNTRWHAVGDPTEGALVMVAAHSGLPKAELDRLFPRIAELPFDSERKRMTTAHTVAPAQTTSGLRLAPGRNGGAGLPERLATGQDHTWAASFISALAAPSVAFTKGAVDGLLEVSTRVWIDGQVVALDASWRERIDAAHTQMAQQGMRVLGVAFRPLGELSAEIQPPALESNLIFVGLVGMIDPPRPEVRAAVQICKDAGIRPVMITGDHALTALHIAKQLGITANDRILTGRELEMMPAADLERVVEEVSVYARVSPEHKLKIVQALQTRGHVVAMTGDGVNDAPALKKADIGVAMGITGTDVSKEAADMVLRDDNFATIVAAVEEGRVIYDNIRKFVKFSIAGNIGKILTVLLGTAVLGTLAGMPLPILPLQLLWLNLLTDGLLGLGLGVEPAERNVMRRRPHAPGESIFARGMGLHIVWLGLVIGAVALGIGYWAWRAGAPHWQTMVFTTLAFAQIGQALAIRSGRDSLFTIGLGSNVVLLGMSVLTFVLQLAVIFWAPLQAIFSTAALPVSDLLICVAAGLLIFVIVELEKWWQRHDERRAALLAPSVEGHI